MNGKYVILVWNSSLPLVPVAVKSDKFDFGDEPILLMAPKRQFRLVKENIF